MGKYALRSSKRRTGGEDKGSVHPKKSRANELTEPATKIQDLNDDCIDKIFGYLSYDDVLSVSQVCQRFEIRARDTFRRKRHNVHVFTVEANESKYLLRRIGPALSKLEIFFGEDVVRNAQTIDVATKCCVDTLTEITLHCLSKRNKLRKPFNRVDKLTLSFCDMIGHFKLVKWFPNLTCLTYHHTKNLKKFMNQNIPSLDTLNINYVTTHKETITMLTANPQIRTLSLTFVSEGGLGIQHNLLAAIDKALPQLETLNLVIDRVRNFQSENSPPYFQQLKALKIENYSDYSNTGLINNLGISTANLERLQLRLSDTTIDSHYYHCITKFKNLRILQMMPAQRSLSIADILMLINQLPLLVKIEQTVDFSVITPWTSDEVAHFLRTSNQLLEMSFVFVYEAQAKFNRTLYFMQMKFNGSNWIVKSEERQATKIFDSYGVSSVVQKQFVIIIAKKL